MEVDMSASSQTKPGKWYEICFLGHLERSRVSDLDELTVTHRPNGETVLCGLIPDQAALYGILNRLQNLGVPLLSVNQIKDKADAPKL